MKKTLIAAALATATLAAAPAFAAPANKAASAPAGQYLTAQLAIAEVGGAYDSGISFVGTYGMPLPQVNPNVAFEAEFSKAISKPSYSVAGNNLEVDYYTLGGYGVYNIPTSPQMNIRLRLGLIYEHVTADYCFPFIGCSSVSDSDIGLSAGVGLTFKLQSNMNFIAEYTSVESDIDHISAGVQIKF